MLMSTGKRETPPGPAMNTKRRIGIDFKDEGTGSELSARDVLDLARQAEAAGFESMWLNEDIGRDSIAMLAAISTTTKSIGVGTAIVNVYTRSAFQIAMAAATLDELSQGRARLGLSVGHHPWNDLAHGIPLEGSTFYSSAKRSAANNLPMKAASFPASIADWALASHGLICRFTSALPGHAWWPWLAKWPMAC